jgi:hypothetical protein
MPGGAGRLQLEKFRGFFKTNRPFRECLFKTGTQKLVFKSAAYLHLDKPCPTSPVFIETLIAISLSTNIWHFLVHYVIDTMQKILQNLVRLSF